MSDVLRSQREEFFLNTLHDLREKRERSSGYQLLKSSELVRSLLFDTSGPLLHKVNKRFRIKVRFEYSDFSKGSTFKYLLGLGADTLSVGDGLFPPDRIANCGPVVKGSLGDFLGTVILVTEGKRYSVKDLLDFCLYALGGTHHNDRRFCEQTALARLNESQVFGVGVVERQLRAIAGVVLEALKPVAEEIHRSRA